MKKLTLGIMLLMLIVLVGCGGNEPRKAIYDTPEEGISNTLKLKSVLDGVSLNASIDKSKAFSDVKMAEDPASTLFYNTVSIEEFLGDSFNRTQVNALFFNGKIYSSDVTSFFNEMNHADYGITKDKVGKDFNTESSTSGTLFGRLGVSTSLHLPEGYGKQEGKTATLVVTYLPVYCIFNDGSQDYTRVYLMVPVYYHFTYMVGETLEDTNVSDILHYQVTLTDGVLPSAPIKTE